MHSDGVIIRLILFCTIVTWFILCIHIYGFQTRLNHSLYVTYSMSKCRFFFIFLRATTTKRRHECQDNEPEKELQSEFYVFLKFHFIFFYNFFLFRLDTVWLKKTWHKLWLLHLSWNLLIEEYEIRLKW